MRITYLGHAAFLLENAAGTRVLTDPYDTSAFADKLLYGPITEKVDLVTVSHSHGDHSGTQALPGTPHVVSTPAPQVAKDVRIKGVVTAHDEIHGATRGKNIIFITETDGLKTAHCGDLGHVLTEAQRAEVGPVDILLVPVGGYYTIDAAAARTVAGQLEAKVIVPMHYRTAKCLFPIAAVDAFLSGWKNVVREGKSDAEVTKEALPGTPTVYVLEPKM